MSEYRTPGVYIEELKGRPRPIEGVSTSTSAFLGETERGPLRPRLVTSFAEYRLWFGGGLDGDRWMLQAVHGFFQNGGKRLYICRVVGEKATPASKVLGDLRVTASGPGRWGRRVWVKLESDSTQSADGFSLKLAYWSKDPKTFSAFDPFADEKSLPRPQYQERYDHVSLANAPLTALVTIAPFKPGTLSKPPTKGPNEPGDFLDEDGSDGPTPVNVAAFKGSQSEDRPSGLLALELPEYHDVALVHAPHPPSETVEIALAVIDHCERLRFRFAVIDADRDAEPSSLDPRRSFPVDTTRAAFYAPWLCVSDPETGVRRTVPPGGHVLGVYARTDVERGVFKAPANAVVRGAVDLRYHIDQATQEILTPRGVNVIRQFPTRGILVWGARTLSSDTSWKYIPLRRFFIFLEHSIDRGTQWVVFEPNAEPLWAPVRDAIRDFLRSQWRDGALLGKKEEEAFSVRCDRTTMTQDDIDSGRLVCEIGVSPLKPAEFVIFRIVQRTAEARP